MTLYSISHESTNPAVMLHAPAPPAEQARLMLLLVSGHFLLLPGPALEACCWGRYMKCESSHGHAGLVCLLRLLKGVNVSGAHETSERSVSGKSIEAGSLHVNRRPFQTN
jgi:hypothetical protein